MASTPSSPLCSSRCHGDIERRFPIHTENYITVLTPAKYDYQCLPEVSVSRKRYVAFRVCAMSDAHIALSSVYGDTSEGTYEIVIGADNNVKTMIRDGGQGEVMEWTVTRGVLSEEEFQPFWIGWDKETVAVGKGMKRGEECILSWKVPKEQQHSVNCISVSSAPGSPGQWQFIEYIGKKPLN